MTATLTIGKMARNEMTNNTTAGTNNLGEYVARRRKELGLLPVDLARRTGRTEGWVSRVEKGLTRQPGLDTLVRLAEALEVDLPTLAAGAGLPMSAAPDVEGDPEWAQLVRQVERQVSGPTLEYLKRQLRLWLNEARAERRQQSDQTSDPEA